MATKFFTNAQGNTLIREFEGILAANPLIKNLDAVVGFLRASGYFALRPFLDGVERVRVLIGIDVDKYIAQAANHGRLFFGAGEEVRADFLAQFRKDLENAPYRQDVETGMHQMVEDITSGKLELRAHPSKKIHAKMYILYPEEFNQYTMAAAITGSSNLSGNGLGIGEDRQYEFNVKLQDFEDVNFAKDEFERLWEEAEGCPITAPDVQTTIDVTYLGADATPYEIYVKTLIEYFGDRVEASVDDDPLEMPEGYAKFDYQLDAVIEGYRKLVKYDGFFLADVVGLGKTIIATMIAKKFLLENGRDNSRILVVYPPAVEQNWKKTFADFGIQKYADFVSNGSLDKILDAENYDYGDPGDYDLVLVDEAHKFRSNATDAFTSLQEICKMPRLHKGGIPGWKKKVMLISATPMNNSPADLYNEIQLFQDPRRCTIDGVSNLSAFFTPLIQEFKRLRRNPDYDLAQFKALAERVREAVVKPLTVRRTRTDIESIPRYAKDVRSFPKVANPIKTQYELKPHIADLFEAAMDALQGELSYARYQAIAYLKPEAAEGRYEHAELVSRALAGISKNSLVKRLESSFAAFKASLGNFRRSNERLIRMFKADKVFIAPDVDLDRYVDAGYGMEQLEEIVAGKGEDDPRNAVFRASDFKPEFIQLLKKDQKILESLCSAWDAVSDADDSKFAAFNDLLKHRLFSRDRNPQGKLVVFSESKDTIDYLARRIGRGDVLVVSAESRARQYKTICENFDANYRTHLDDYNIILTTDVLAEGVNLHRSNIVVNYDTPWNATRLMQRIGRVNRIGSASNTIYNYVFYPSREGDREINLNRVALSKIQTFHTTFGEDNKIYSEKEILDRDLDKLFSDAEEIQREDFNLEIPFYEELRALYVQNRREYNRISKLSVRSRTGRASRTVDGVTYSADTLVFLRTNLRKAFFRASDDSVDELTVLEALAAFRAAVEEKRRPRVDHHHAHVEKALDAFRSSVIQRHYEEENVAAPRANEMGAQVGIAIALVNAVSHDVPEEEDRQKLAHLVSLIQRGALASIAKNLQRLSGALRRRGKNRDAAIAEIVEMARKYDPYYLSEEELTHEEETDVGIILSESFE